MKWRIYRLRKKLAVLWLVLRDGGHRCAYCHCEFGTGNRARTVDHILAKSRGGTWRPSNLAFACLACNRRKGDKLVSVFLRCDWLKARNAGVAERKTR